MYVKLCGITRPADAVLAADLGADAIGLNFWPSSLRYVGDGAAKIADAVRGRLTLVGVFVDAPAAVVLEVLDRHGLDFAQLHGSEKPQECTAIPRERWYKALRATDRSVLSTMDAFPCSCFLLDAGRPGQPGGTGETCDWTIAAEAARSRRIVLAGGLGAHNVGDAIRAVRPYGVDAASGIEESPGIKDPQKMRAFVEAVRAVQVT